MKKSGENMLKDVDVSWVNSVSLHEKSSDYSLSQFSHLIELEKTQKSI